MTKALASKPIQTIEAAEIFNTLNSIPGTGDTMLRVDRQDITVRVDQILYVKAVQDYTLFCLWVSGGAKTKSLLTPMTLRDAISGIQSTDFIPVHRSYVINLRAVQRIETVEGKSFVRIENTELVPISRARRSETKKRIQSLT